MFLIFLHGPPGVGKLTVANELARLIPAKVIDNHQSIDVARRSFEFGAPGFWPLVAKLRQKAIAEAARSDAAYVVTTSCYSHPEDLPAFEAVEALFEGRIAPIFLTCPMDVLETRIGAGDRSDRGKLASVTGLRKFLGAYNVSPVPRPTCKTIDTGRLSPRQAALDILERLEISR